MFLVWPSKGSTYRMALLSLNEDKPKAIPGVHPARFVVYPGVNVTNSTEPIVTNAATYVFEVGLGTGVPGGLVVVALVLIAAFWIRRKAHRR